MDLRNTTRRDFLRLVGQAGLGAGAAGLLGGCRGGAWDGLTGATKHKGMEYITVAPSNWGFAGKSTGKPFVPMGCNYYDPETGFFAPHIWSEFHADRVRRHFELMQEINVNVCRVFLSVGYFMPEAGKLSAEGMDKLDTMVSLGREHGVRFVLSALNYWEGRSTWREGDPYSDPVRIERECDYMEQLSRHFQGDAALFSFDITNEPRAPWGGEEMAAPWLEWLKGYAERTPADRDAIAAYLAAEPKIPSGRTPIENDPILYAFQQYRETLATRYVRDRTAAIKRGDADRLASIGLIQYSFPLGNRPGNYAAFNPQSIAEHVDYMSIHFYPLLPNNEPLGKHIEVMRRYAKAWARYAYAGKPLVYEEFGWAGGGPGNTKHFYSEQDQVDWNAGLIEMTEDSCCGWLVWPFADTTSLRADISKDGGFFYTDWRKKAWADVFTKLSKRLTKSPPRRVAGQRTVSIDMRLALTTMGEKVPMYETKFAQWLFAELAKDGVYDVVQKR